MNSARALPADFEVTGSNPTKKYLMWFRFGPAAIGISPRIYGNVRSDEALAATVVLALISPDSSKPTSLYTEGIQL